MFSDPHVSLCEYDTQIVTDTLFAMREEPDATMSLNLYPETRVRDCLENLFIKLIVQTNVIVANFGRLF